MHSPFDEGILVSRQVGDLARGLLRSGLHCHHPKARSDNHHKLEVRGLYPPNPLDKFDPSRPQEWHGTVAEVCQSYPALAAVAEVELWTGSEKAPPTVNFQARTAQ